MLKKIFKIFATRCLFFEAKMHQIRFRLGLHSRPYWETWESLQRSPDSLAGFEGLLLKIKKGKKGKKRKEKERAGIGEARYERRKKYKGDGEEIKRGKETKGGKKMCSKNFQLY